MIRFAPLALLSLLAGPVAAAEPPEGVYCNTAEQIDALIDMIGQGASPEDAVAAMEGCTQADRVAWLVTNPQPVESPRPDGRFRYRALLIGVIVEGEVKGVNPPAQVYFYRSEAFDGASVGA